MRQLSFIDKTLLGLDKVLRRSSNSSSHNEPRPNPADNITTKEQLSQQEQQQSIAMMRINHSGEICAQALYLGQALSAKSETQYNTLLKSAAEETDHLNWCQQRLHELNGRASLINPLWYAGSLGIGIVAGMAGDKISLGFLSETERQVTRHLDKHLAKLSLKDQKSRAILQQMRTDELQHANTAEQAGAINLPIPIKIAMKFSAKIMTITAAKI